MHVIFSKRKFVSHVAKIRRSESFFLQHVCESEDSSSFHFDFNRISCFGNMLNFALILYSCGHGILDVKFMSIQKMSM
jgi:hypothetical protein